MYAWACQARWKKALGVPKPCPKRKQSRLGAARGEPSRRVASSCVVLISRVAIKRYSSVTPPGDEIAHSESTVYCAVPLFFHSLLRPWISVPTLSKTKSSVRSRFQLKFSRDTRRRGKVMINRSVSHWYVRLRDGELYFDGVGAKVKNTICINCTVK